MLKRRLIRFLADSRGADLVEYALLVAFFGLVAATGFDAIETAIAAVYGAWDSGIQDLYLPDDPLSYGS